jgi:hypothetical protein
MIDAVMDLVEYLAVLVTPHPKETMQVIEKRRKDLEAARLKAGLIDKAEEQASNKLFKHDHRNTTFYDDIRKMAGDSAADTLLFEDENGEAPTPVETYEPDFEDLAFIEKARAMQEDLLKKQAQEKQLNTVDY